MARPPDRRRRQRAERRPACPAPLAMTAPQIIPPGSTIGILGGGQLGRMTALAAARLGYRCLVYAPDEHSIAGDVAAGHVRGAYGDAAALGRFARVRAPEEPRIRSGNDASPLRGFRFRAKSRIRANRPRAHLVEMVGSSSMRRYVCG